MRTSLILAMFALASFGQAQNTVTGSGFFVSPDGYLLTNLHVIKNCQVARLNVGGALVPAPVLFSDAKNDLALLKSNHPPSFLVFREDQRLKLGESIIAVGYPLAGVVASSMNLTTGTVSALAGMGDDTRMIQFTAPVQPGNSGGPLLDQSGHVVGIVASKLSPLWAAEHLGDIPQNVNFAIKASVVRDFLDSKGVEYSAMQSTNNVATTTVAEQVQSAVISVECVPGQSGGAVSVLTGSADAGERTPPLFSDFVISGLLLWVLSDTQKPLAWFGKNLLTGL
jgi:S1-C subfamily serine protease